MARALVGCARHNLLGLVDIQITLTRMFLMFPLAWIRLKHNKDIASTSLYYNASGSSPQHPARTHMRALAPTWANAQQCNTFALCVRIRARTSLACTHKPTHSCSQAHIHWAGTPISTFAPVRVRFWRPHLSHNITYVRILSALSTSR